MSTAMTSEEYESLKAREAAFNAALKESSKWAVLAKPIQQKQISQMLSGSMPVLTPSERLVMQSAEVATEKLSQVMEQYMAKVI